MKQKPSIEEIRKRWSRSRLPEMLFSGHVALDIEVLLERIDALEGKCEHLWNVHTHDGHMGINSLTFPVCSKCGLRGS